MHLTHIALSSSHSFYFTLRVLAELAPMSTRLQAQSHCRNWFYDNGLKLNIVEQTKPTNRYACSSIMSKYAVLPVCPKHGSQSASFMTKEC